MLQSVVKNKVTLLVLGFLQENFIQMLLVPTDINPVNSSSIEQEFYEVFHFPANNFFRRKLQNLIPYSRVQ